jgi:hypothetical protein
MPLNEQDFKRFADMTVVESINAYDLNNLIDQSRSYQDGDALVYRLGKGLLLSTIDTALDTPDVPNPAVNPKWERYLWIRHLHSSADVTIPVVYVWDSNSVGSATLLKWIPIAYDDTALTARVTQAELDINTVETTAAQASATATAANNSAATALQKANTAATDAANAASEANSASNKADTADSKATTALTNANTAVQKVKKVESAQAAIGTSANLLCFTEHNFGIQPTLVRGVLVCTAANFGFNIGDEIDSADILIWNPDGTWSKAFIAGANATHLYVSQRRKLATEVRYFIGKADPHAVLQVFNYAQWAIKVVGVYIL